MRKRKTPRSPLEGNSQAAKQARRAAAETTPINRKRAAWKAAGRDYDKCRKAHGTFVRNHRDDPQPSRFHHQRSAAARLEWRNEHRRYLDPVKTAKEINFEADRRARAAAERRLP